MNKRYLNRNNFEILNDWNIITLLTQTKHYKSEKDDKAEDTNYYVLSYKNRW